MMESRNYIMPGEYTQHHDTWFVAEPYDRFGGSCLSQCDCRAPFNSQAPCSGFCFRWNANASMGIPPLVFRKVQEPDPDKVTAVATPASLVADWTEDLHDKYLRHKLTLESPRK